MVEWGGLLWGLLGVRSLPDPTRENEGVTGRGEEGGGLNRVVGSWLLCRGLLAQAEGGKIGSLPQEPPVALNASRSLTPGPVSTVFLSGQVSEGDLRRDLRRKSFGSRGARGDKL